jgi:hypothetical protein
MTKDEALVKAASALENMEKTLKSQSEKIASLDKRERCEKLAEKMIDKGLLRDSVVSYKEKVAHLMREDDLNSWEKAIDISLGGLDLGEDDDREKVASAKGINAIEALIMESVID